MKDNKLYLICALLMMVPVFGVHAIREVVPMDKDWRFALGHASDPVLDHGHGTGYFSYLAKTGFGDGPASAAFDDRTWRTVRLPHDWAVELPFHPEASHSHGYKVLGPGFPENSIGWYRYTFPVGESELGRRIWVEFDGIYRDAHVFINGFFVGSEPSGYLGQAYDLTDYLNYGGANVLAVRVDATKEEGWFYEGAGIYRHARFVKTSPQYWVKDGLWVRSEIDGDRAEVSVDAEVRNDGDHSATLRVECFLRELDGSEVASWRGSVGALSPGETRVVAGRMQVEQPALWSVDAPNLYEVKIRLIDEEGRLVDQMTTRMGIRSIRFDPDEGFFLNGVHLKIKGTNNHQDHAGVGAAIPDALQEWRILQLKAMGSNTYRASHNPPTPELLESCDRLGMLVINETRLMGINPYHLNQLERLIRRDRNHPSVIMWCLGNEEWAIEGNVKGERITHSMQDFARRLDPTRPMSVAVSGGWGGISRVVEVLGVNYIRHGDTDRQHVEYPWQIILGTEETTTQQTRGIYFEDKDRCHLPPQEDGSSGGNAETGWQHYAARPYLAGVCYWTGFDYRGEPTPYGYPAISSQFGILDTCGFPKDGFYYLKSWWGDAPVLHLFPHWNWSGREGQVIDVRVHSNAQTVELFLNGVSLGSKEMPLNGHLAWAVPYVPGELRAEGVYADQSRSMVEVRTTGVAHALSLESDREHLKAGKRDLAVVKVAVQDARGDLMPVAGNPVRFTLKGPGAIIGVGNGDPSSHEADQMLPEVWSAAIGTWTPPNPADAVTPVVFEADFERPDVADGVSIVLLINALGEGQQVFLNGQVLPLEGARAEVPVDPMSLLPSGNRIRIEATPFPVWRDREGLFQFDPATLRFERAAPQWQRSVFNGLAQVIVESDGNPGEIMLIAESEGLSTAQLVMGVGE